MRYFLTGSGINMVNDDAADKVRQNFPQFKEVDIFVGEDERPVFIYKEKSAEWLSMNPGARQYQYGQHSRDNAPDYEAEANRRWDQVLAERAVDMSPQPALADATGTSATPPPAAPKHKQNVMQDMAREMRQIEPFLALDEMLSEKAGNIPVELQRTQQRARVHRERIAEYYEPYAMGMTPRQHREYEEMRQWADDKNGLAIMGENIIMGALDYVTAPYRAAHPGSLISDMQTYGKLGLNQNAGTVQQLFNSVAYSLPPIMGMVAFTMASGGLGSLAGAGGIWGAGAKAGSWALQGAGYGMTAANIMAPLNKDDYDKGRLNFENVMLNLGSATVQTAIEYVNLGSQMGRIQNAWKSGGKQALSELAQGYVKDALNTGIKAFGKPVLMSGLQEGAEEMAQDITEKMFNLVKGDPLPPIDQWAQELAMNFAGGLLGGLIFGAVGSGVQMSINQSVAKTLEYNATRYPNSVAHLQRAVAFAQNQQWDEALQSVMEFEKGNAYDKVQNLNIQKAHGLVLDAIRLNDASVMLERQQRTKERNKARAVLEREFRELQNKRDAGTLTDKEEERMYIVEDKLAVYETEIDKEAQDAENIKSLRQMQVLAKEVGILNQKIKAMNEQGQDSSELIEQRDIKQQELKAIETSLKAAIGQLLGQLPKSEQQRIMGEKYPAHQVLKPQASETGGTESGQQTSQPGAQGDAPRVLTAEEREAQRQGIKIDQSRGMKAGDVNEMIDRSDPQSLEEGVKPVSGKETKVRTSSSRKITARWILVKLKDLVVSNDPMSFSENKEYPGEIQNRKRDRAALREQVENIAKEPDPELLANNPLGQYGAPVIFRDKSGRWVVLGGNGRVMGLKRRLSMMGAESLQEYEAYVKEHLAEFGFDPDTDTTGMVLVRDYYGDEDVIEMSRELNSSETAEISPMEQASGDAVTIANAIRKGNNILDFLDFNQPLTPDKQEAFYNAFYKLCVKDGNQYRTKEGYTTRMQERVEMAMWMYLFNGDSKAEDLLSAYFETEKSNIKSIITGIVDNMPVIISLRRMTEKYNLPDYDISQIILKAISEISAAKAKGIKLEQLIEETDIFSENQNVVPEDMVDLYRALFTIRSMKAGRAFFGGYYSEALVGLDPEQDSLFSLTDSSPEEYLNEYIGEWITNERRKKEERAAARANQKSDPASLDTGGDAPETDTQTRQSRNLQNKGYPGREDAVQAVKQALAFKEGVDSISFSEDGRVATIDTADGRHVILNLHEKVIQGSYGPAAGQMSRKIINGKLTYIIDLVEAYNSGNRSLYHESFHMAWFMSTTAEQRQFLERYYTKQILGGKAVDENGRRIQMTAREWNALSDEERSVEIEEQAAMGAEAFWGARGDELPTMVNKIWHRFWDRIRSGLVAIGWASENMTLEDIFVRAGTGKLGGAGIDYMSDVSLDKPVTLGEDLSLRIKDKKTAIEKLFKTGPNEYGQVTNAFDKPGIGNIDLVWGFHNQYGNGVGLAHIVAKHPEITPELLMTIVKEGAVMPDVYDSTRLNIRYGKYKLVIAPVMDGMSKTWIVTCYLQSKENATTKLEDVRDAKQGQHTRPDPERSRDKGSDTKDDRQGKSDRETRNKNIPTQKQANEVIGMMYARGRNLIEQKLPNRFSKDTLRNMLSKDMKDDEFLAFQLEGFLAKAPDMISKAELNKWLDSHEYKIKVQVLSGNNRNKENDSKYDTYSSRFGEDYREYLFKSSAAEGYWAPHFSKANIVMHMRLSDVKEGGDTITSTSNITFNGKDYGWDDEDNIVMLTGAINNKIKGGSFEAGIAGGFTITKDMLLEFKRMITQKGSSIEEAAHSATASAYVGVYAALDNQIPDEYKKHIRAVADQLKKVTPSDTKVLGHSQKPGLLIEEMQSDFHQAAREQGYRDPAKEAETKAILKELDRKQRRLLSKNGYKDMSSFLEAERAINETTKVLERQMVELVRRDMLKLGLSGVDSEDKTEWEKRAEANFQKIIKIRELKTEIMNIENQRRAQRANLEALPNLPLKKFHEFLFKYALLESAQKGYGDIYWTTGDMQAYRYGRDAERESGMKGFYDKIVGDYANKLGKRYGVKTDVVTLNNPKRGNAEFNHLTITPEMRNDLIKDGLPRYKLAPDHTDQWIDGTGDVVAGDHIQFTEAVFNGSYKSPKYAGDRTIEAIITKDSYGRDKQQHTFTMEVVSSTGERPLTPGQKIRRKGRNVYKNGTKRLKWQDETARQETADEKHARGDAARRARDRRKHERFKMIPEEMLRRMEAAMQLADSQDQDAVIDQTVARAAEERGLDKTQVKDKIGRAIRAAYREGDERIQKVLAASTIAGIDRYIETNKPETRDQEDLTYHLEEAEADAYENDLGISAAEAMKLGEDRYSYYLGGLKVFAMGNAIMDELMAARAEAARLRAEGRVDEALEEKIELLTGMAINSKLAYDNIKGNAGRILRHAREEKTERIRQYTELMETMQSDEAELYEQIADLQAEIDEQEALLAELERTISELESVHTDLIESSEDLIRKVDRIIEGNIRFRQVDRKQQIEKLKERQAELRRRSELAKARMEQMIARAKATQEQMAEIGKVLDEIKPGKQPRINDLPKVKPGLYDYLKSAMYQGMLSSPMTHYRNLVGNLTSLVSELVVDIVNDPKGGLIAMLNAMTSIPESLVAAKDTFKDASEYVKKYDITAKRTKLMKLFTIVTRILAAEDAYAYNMAFTAQLASLAVMESRRTGTGYKSLIKNPTKEMVKQAQYEARRATFNYNPEGIIGIVISQIDEGVRQAEKTGAIGKAAALAFKYNVMPFTRVVANVMSWGLEWTPLGYLMAVKYGNENIEKQRQVWIDGRNPMQSPYRRRDITRSLTRATLGTVMMIIAQTLFSEMISGGGPPDWEKRRQLMETGWRPYSLKIGDRWIPYNDYWMGTALAVIGNWNDYKRYNKRYNEATGWDKLSYALMGISNTFLSKSFLSGMQNTMNAISDQRGSFVSSQIAGFVGSVAPGNLARLVGDYFYRDVHKPESLTQYLIVATRPLSLPVMDAVPKNVNVLGQTVQRQPFWHQIIGSPDMHDKPYVVQPGAEELPVDIRAALNVLADNSIRIPGASSFQIKTDEGKFVLKGHDRETYRRIRGEEVTLFLLDEMENIMDAKDDPDEVQRIVSTLGGKATREAKKRMVDLYYEGQLRHKYQIIGD